MHSETYSIVERYCFLSIQSCCSFLYTFTTDRLCGRMLTRVLGFWSTYSHSSFNYILRLFFFNESVKIVYSVCFQLYLKCLLGHWTQFINWGQEVWLSLGWQRNLSACELCCQYMETKTCKSNAVTGAIQRHALCAGARYTLYQENGGLYHGIRSCSVTSE